jgi:hypothetical protein
MRKCSSPCLSATPANKSHTTARSPVAAVASRWSRGAAKIIVTVGGRAQQGVQAQDVLVLVGLADRPCCAAQGIEFGGYFEALGCIDALKDVVCLPEVCSCFGNPATGHGGSTQAG